MVDPGPAQPDYGMPPPPPPYAAVPAPPSASNRLPLILAVIIGVMVLCCGGGTAVALITGVFEEPVAAPATTAPARPAPSSAPATAAPSPTVSAPPAALPADVVYQGRGDKVVKLKAPVGSFQHFAVISHQGRSNFAIWSLDSGGGRLGLMVNEIGRYQGASPFDLDNTPAALKVEADGSWKIVVKVLAKAPVWPARSSGKGAAVLVVRQGTIDDIATVKVTHKGTSNFVVRSYGESPDLLVNEIGKYSGEVPLPDDTTVIAIEGDGSWTMKPS